MNSSSNRSPQDKSAPRNTRNTTVQQPSPQTADGLSILELQHTIGNQALQRLINKQPVQVRQRVPPSSVQRVQRSGGGLAETAPLETFAQAAVAYCRDTGNADKLLTDFTVHMMGKINEALKAIPSEECPHSFVSTGTMGSFSGGTFSMLVNTSDFTKRPGITKASQLNQGEIAEIIDTIYHEARHAEQYYRVARVLAGKGKSAAEIAQVVGIPNTIAAKAFANPLNADSSNAAIISEAELWQPFIGRGEYSTGYKSTVANLRDAIAPARQKLAADDREGFKTEFAKVTTIVTTKLEPLILTVEGKPTKTSADNIVLTDAKAIKDKYDVLKPLADNDTTLISALVSAATALHTARYQAYRNYPHEMDAWARGGEAGAKYKELDNAAASTPPPTTEPSSSSTPPSSISPSSETTPVSETTSPTTEPSSSSTSPSSTSSTSTSQPTKEEEQTSRKKPWYKRLLNKLKFW